MLEQMPWARTNLHGDQLHTFDSRRIVSRLNILVVLRSKTCHHQSEDLEKRANEEQISRSIVIVELANDRTKEEHEESLEGGDLAVFNQQHSRATWIGKNLPMR